MSLAVQTPPAGMAAVSNAYTHGRGGRTAASMLDSLVDPAFWYDVDGAPAHANSAAARLETNTSNRLHEEAQRLAWSLGAMARRATKSA